MIGSVSVDMISKVCPMCGAAYAVASRFDKARQEDGEPFYCPNGHSLVYNGGKHRAEKELEKERERRKRAELEAANAKAEVANAKAEVANAKAEAAKREREGWLFAEFGQIGGAVHIVEGGAGRCHWTRKKPDRMRRSDVSAVDDTGYNLCTNCMGNASPDALMTVREMLKKAGVRKPSRWPDKRLRWEEEKVPA